MLDFHRVRTGEGPPAACGRCEPSPVVQADEQVVLRALQMTIGRADGSRPHDIVFAGGEPLEHDGFERFVSAAADGGARRIAAITAGAALGDPLRIEGLIRAGLRHVHVTVPTLDPGAYTAHSCGAPEGALAGMRSLRAAGERVGARTLLYGRIPVCAHNVESLSPLVAALAAAGADAVALVTAANADARRLVPWISAAFDTGLMNGIWVWVEGPVAESLVPAACVLAPIRIVEVTS